MRRTLLIATVITAALLLTGCTAPQHRTDRVETVWSIPAQIVGQPAVAGDTIVAYTHRDTTLHMTAWDLNTGDELWSEEALPTGSATRALKAEVVTLDGTGYTAFFAPVPDSEYVTLLAADITTGETVEFSGSLRTVQSHISTCDGLFCFDGTSGNTTHLTRQILFDPRNGVAATNPDTIAYDGGLRLAGDLVVSETDDTGEELLQMMDRRDIVWSRPYTDVFGAGSTFAAGHWWWVTDRDPIIGFGNVNLREHPTTTVTDDDNITVDLSDDTRHGVAGLDRTTGDTVWFIPGAQHCGAHHDSDTSATTIPLCRHTAGTRTNSWDDDDVLTTEYTDARLEVLAVDTTTGDIVWETSINDITAPEDHHRYRAGDDQLAVLTAAGIVLIDLETGQTRTPSDNEYLACLTPQHRDIDDSRAEIREQYAGTTMQACNTAGEPTDTLTPLVVESAGVAAADNHWVLATADTLTLVHITPVGGDHNA